MLSKVISGIVLAAATFSSVHAAETGFAGCSQFFANDKAPVVSTGVGEQRAICFTSFALLHSGQSKTAVFTAERLTADSLAAGKGLKRTDRFYEEARLPRSERSTLSDYKSRIAGPDGELRFDRGHLVPAADSATEEAMAQSFSLANMVPQSPQNNRGPWADIEKATRKYVSRAKGDVFVYTGPVYTKPVTVLGPNKVWVPTYLYKLVYDASANRAWAHWIENTDSARVTKPISYKELVERTGIEFLPGLNPKS